MSKKLPILIVSKNRENEDNKITKKTTGLSSLIYNFKKINKIEITKPVAGVIKIVDESVRDIGHKHTINFSTIGDLELKSIYIISESLNKYNLIPSDPSGGKYYDAELLIVLQNTGGTKTKSLLLFIPVKTTSGNTSDSFFSHINNTIGTVGQKNIKLNDIIPGGPFLYYPKVENFGALNETLELPSEKNVIFFHNSILINSDKLTSLKILNPIGDLINPPRVLGGSLAEFDVNDVFYNDAGAKNTNNVYDDELVPMDCEPIEDENGDPVYGNRFDWIKRAGDNLNKSAKNYLFVILLVLVLSVVLYFSWKAVFTTIGGLNGPVFISNRIS